MQNCDVGRIRTYASEDIWYRIVIKVQRRIIRNRQHPSKFESNPVTTLVQRRVWRRWRSNAYMKFCQDWSQPLCTLTQSSPQFSILGIERFGSAALPQSRIYPRSNWSINFSESDDASSNRQVRTPGCQELMSLWIYYAPRLVILIVIRTADLLTLCGYMYRLMKRRGYTAVIQKAIT